MEEKNKWYYIKAISDLSTRTGDKLLQMMEEFGAKSLKEVTDQQAQEFYERLVG